MKNIRFILCGYLIVSTSFLSANSLLIPNFGGIDLVTPLTGSAVTNQLLVAGTEQGLPLVVGLLSDSPLTPLVELGAPKLVEVLTPVLGLPYKARGLDEQLQGLLPPEL